MGKGQLHPPPFNVHYLQDCHARCRILLTRPRHEPARRTAQHSLFTSPAVLDALLSGQLVLAKALSLVRLIGRRLTCNLVAQAKELSKERFKGEVERHLTGKEAEPWELLYFKVFRGQLAVIERAHPWCFSIWMAGGHMLL